MANAEDIRKSIKELEQEKRQLEWRLNMINELLDRYNKALFDTVNVNLRGLIERPKRL